MRISDWSSDVCSSDLPGARGTGAERRPPASAPEQETDPPSTWRPFVASCQRIARAGAANGWLFGVGPISDSVRAAVPAMRDGSCRGAAARSEEHTSELQSLMRISYAVYCLKKKN